MDTESAYIYGPGDTPIEQVELSSGDVSYLVSDSLGSVRGVVDGSDGSLTAATSYDSWGNPETTGGLTSETPFGYAGGYTDASGLVYLVHRYYDPATGQFLSVDPLVNETGSVYAYANDNPVDELDLLGLCGGWGWADGQCEGEWVYNHPAEAGGIALGAVSLATGVGEVAGAAVVIGDLSVDSAGLGAVSLATGVAGSAVDANDCFSHHDKAACVGLALSVPGGISGVAEFALPAGYLTPAVQTELEYLGLATGAAGFGVDLARLGCH